MIQIKFHILELSYTYAPITTPRLTLLPIDLPTYELIFAGMDELGSHLNVQVPAVFDPEFGMDP